MIKHREYLLVTIREGAQDLTVSSPEDDFPAQLSYDRQIDDEESGSYGEWEQTDIDLPPGTYQLIGLAAELTEEQKREIVGLMEHYDGFYGYPCFDGGIGFYLDPVLAFNSLLRSHNLKPETTLILKQVEV